ncbi:MAG TPA: tetratricopeptide repeat protein [Candidatus Paceibacterota bacterium]|nr:tetratricopeptide repeat protein [Candidatus Paceibacterota bacterium]
MHSQLVSWSRYIFLAALVLALVLIIPTVWFPLQVGKVAVFAVLLFVALFLYALGGGGRDLMRAHGLHLALLMLALPAAYLISAFFSVDPVLSYIGSGLEADTMLFSVLVFLTFLGSFALFRTLRTAGLLLRVVSITLIVAVVLQWIIVLFGTTLVPFSIFSDRSVNLIGKWNDLGLLAGLLGTMLLARLELGAAQTLLWRALTIALGIVVIALLAIINFSLVWGFLLAAAIAVAVIKLLTQRMGESEMAGTAPMSRTLMQRTPWWAVGGAVIAIVFLFFGSYFNTFITSSIPVTSLEVRPSYSSTVDVINAARGGSVERMLVGTGPNTFVDSWLMHKPASVNQSAFWSLDFSVGFSSVMTALGTVGLLGIIAWLVPMVLVIMSLVRAVRLGVLSREERVVAATIGLSSLYFFASLIFYVPSQNILLLGIVLAGATFGFLWRQGRSTPSEEDMRSPLLTRLVMIGGMPLILLVALGVGFFSGRHYIAEAAVGQGSAALQSSDFDTAMAKATHAAAVESSNPDALRLMVLAGSNKLQQIAQSSATADAQTQFTTLAQQVVTVGQQLVAKDPHDYRSYFLIGQIYDLFASLKVQGAYEKANEAYLQAAALAPSDPQIPLFISRLDAGQNNVTDVQKYLSQSLTLKPNYTDAILFLVQLNVANNDLQSAIQAAQAAVQSAPGVAPIWFELGLLYYSANDSKDAVTALEQAIALQPDYANAQYFLGLSYYAQKRTDDAIKEFQAIIKTNPDSSEARLILANLQAGKAPFDAATPPATTPPQDRTTAPINE